MEPLGLTLGLAMPGAQPSMNSTAVHLHLKDDVCPVLHLAGRKGQLCKFLRSVSVPHMCGKLPLTFSTKVYRLSGISRRVHRRISWILEQVA